MTIFMFFTGWLALSAFLAYTLGRVIRIADEKENQ